MCRSAVEGRSYALPARLCDTGTVTDHEDPEEHLEDVGAERDALRQELGDLRA